MFNLQGKLLFLIGFLITLLLTSSWLQGEESSSPQTPSGMSDHTSMDHPSPAQSAPSVQEHDHSTMPMPSSTQIPPKTEHEHHDGNNMDDSDSMHGDHEQPTQSDSSSMQDHDHSDLPLPSSHQSSSEIGHEQHTGGSDDGSMMHQMMMKHHQEMNEHFERLLPAVENTQYLKECGTCHYPYQPALLPSRSWERLLGDLSHHFGDNIQLEESTLKPIQAYLVDRAADKIGFGRPEIFALSIPLHEAPLRITETSYFQKLHKSVPSHYVITNPRVRSWSQCGACHKEALQGFFNHQEVAIPGVNKPGMGMMGGKRMGGKMKMMNMKK